MTTPLDRWRIGLILVAMLALAGCGGNSDDPSANAANDSNAENNDEAPAELIVSVAASLADVMEDIKADYEKDNNVELTFNLGGSGTLAQQIQQGAPADAFISANQNWMDTLEEEGLLLEGTRADVTGNNLVLIQNKTSDLDYESFQDVNTDDGQVAVGNPESVPAGKYTEQALKSIEKWDELQGAIVFAKDVRQVLTYVETGNAEVGFVYESDAFISDKVDIIAKSEEGMHDPIIYPGAVLADTKHEAEAKAFIDYMQSDEAQEKLAEYGFNK
ncbi:Molybdate-binding periplasmic protein [Lentibacillus sp. JNUCC-1]|uniref:molybdate ABC transporter substrate-binding protein n=1 Tax=Lentibacillus sp. JNUCC-1 TaxID=2654513 RepID=UPI00132634C5|nr:molybdate ABC transporter substrate-binding protein [Lentibacillus sp. JNUCC-1]MUV37599.1 Molybdate-binding periplasmic protein [Lentibacillus sp. JNUCC-1]